MLKEKLEQKLPPSFPNFSATCTDVSSWWDSFTVTACREVKEGYLLTELPMVVLMTTPNIRHRTVLPVADVVVSTCHWYRGTPVADGWWHHVRTATGKWCPNGESCMMSSRAATGDIHTSDGLWWCYLELPLVMTPVPMVAARFDDVIGIRH